MQKKGKHQEVKRWQTKEKKDSTCINKFAGAKLILQPKREKKGIRNQDVDKEKALFERTCNRIVHLGTIFISNLKDILLVIGYGCLFM